MLQPASTLARLESSPVANGPTWLLPIWYPLYLRRDNSTLQLLRAGEEMRFRIAVLSLLRNRRLFSRKWPCLDGRYFLKVNSWRATSPRGRGMVVLGLLVGVGAVSTISCPKVNDIACLFQLGGVSADYVHNSLPSDTSIRLLYLKRPDSEQDNVIRCSLKEVELAKPPDYIAVSYTWGLPEKRAEAYETNSARYHTI